ncbi:MAG TPA: pyruvate kinase [Thermoanaerobaculia bacterium]|nr:pyruvate kinase [Thermoanaerobaculia bacterium]
MRRTKILATLGPACSSAEMIQALVRAGADAFRLNFSHGSHEQHRSNISTIREIAAAEGKFIPIVGDIQGPKIRIGEVYGSVVLKDDAEFVITTEPMIGTEKQVSTPFTPLPSQVRVGDPILINDGLVELEVLETTSTSVRTRVIHGGVISSKKGMNFPETELTIASITEKDTLDLRFAAEENLDYVAASFVQRREDVENIRKLLDDLGKRDIAIIAKLEKKQAIEALDAILSVSDGVMVARGDLGVELPPERVPIMQKRILDRAGHRGRFAITATQMLESMTTNSRPTRAEASDVANAIFDGSDAVMLSAETASGAYPIEAVKMMARIVVEAEANPDLQLHRGRDPFHESFETDEFTDALAGAANYAAEAIDAKYIVVFTQSGFAARLMSKFRPNAPILALAQATNVARRMNLLWGVIPFVVPDIGEYHEQIIEGVEAFLKRESLVKDGDRIVILMGSPVYQRAKTNLLRVHRVGA